MLTKLIARNFKIFGDVEIELGNPVVFIGPNNSGKTSALQVLALWEIGLKRWQEKYKNASIPERRPGVTINRRDLTAIPAPSARLLWRNLHVRNVQRIDGKPNTQNVRIEVIVEGVSRGKEWKCGLEFDYANEESFYCRPLRLADEKNPPRMSIPKEAEGINIAFLLPMSGLAANEIRLEPGTINTRIGEGRTAEVLRNLCYHLSEEKKEKWQSLKEYIQKLFRTGLDEPQYIIERGEITMSYRENGIHMDISSSGRGLQQTLLLLAYMHSNPGSVLLLDEPDAHLEIIRQRHIYQLLIDVARENDSQIIAASHSEVILNEAAGRDMVVAFVGKPHRIDDRGSQVLKALKDIGFEDYYQAELTGWVLYLEGSTDLAILRAFAEKLEHEKAKEILEHPFVHYVGNQPQKSAEHFYGLQYACPDLKGIGIFDHLERGFPPGFDGERLAGYDWKRREIENYFCNRETLLAYAKSLGIPPITNGKMNEAIEEVENAMRTLGIGFPWDHDTKVSDDFLKPLFNTFFAKLNQENLMNKTNYHQLVHYTSKELIDDEVREVLNLIVSVAEEAQPRDANSEM